MINIFKITILVAFISIISSISKAEDCSQYKSLHKKLLCKSNKTTSSLESRETLADFFDPDIKPSHTPTLNNCTEYKSLHKKLLCITNLRKED